MFVKEAKNETNASHDNNYNILMINGIIILNINILVKLQQQK